MGKLVWQKPLIRSFNSACVIQSGDVCVGYEAVMGTAISFYTPSNGLITVNGGCTNFSETNTCEGKNIRLTDGNTCAPVSMVCS